MTHELTPTQSNELFSHGQSETESGTREECGEIMANGDPCPRTPEECPYHNDD